MRKRRWPWVLLAVLGVLAAATAIVLSLPQFGGRLAGERLARAQADPNYRDGAFVNVQPPAPYTWDYLRQIIAGQFAGDEARTPPAPLPALRPVFTATPAPGLRAFWIGHASVYIEIDGLRVLVDPMFSDYASPFAFGPRRFQAPPVALDELPPIDAVLITHDHYDHLDMATVQALARRGTRFFVPLAIGAHLDRWGVPTAQQRELAWWQEDTLRGVRFVATPSRHYSGRGVGDRNATLWTSWSVIGAAHRFHVTGDTGWSDHFRVIGERFGPFDLSFVKIGAYGPGAPWLDIHMSAGDAVRAHRELRAKRLFPVHWGTFNLAFHAWDEPIRRTLAAAKGGGVEVVTPQLGEVVDADAPFASKPWWESVR